MPTRLLACAAALLLSLPAFAQASARLGDDEVLLKNGGMVRGTVVEVTPNNQVTIVIDATGEHRLIPWAEIAELQRGKYGSAAQRGWGSTPPSAAPAPPADAPAPPEEDGRGLVRLHLAGDAPGLQLYLRQPLSEDDKKICNAPCDQEVDGRAGQEFYLAGEGIVRSDTFRLLARQGGIELKAHAASQGTRTLGFVGSVAGYVIGSVGLGLFAAGVAPYGDNGRFLSDTERSNLRIAGGICFAGGLLMALTSLYSLSENHTTFEVHERR